MKRAFHGVCIAGTHSGVGKTTLTLGLLAALRARGIRVQPFKCGPDFIDAGHHEPAAGRQSRNLDTWMMGAAAVRTAYRRATRDVDAAVVEGVMGLFDGASSRSPEGSTAHVCALLDLPVVLVVDAGSMARSIAALVKGFATFDPAVRVIGVIANRVGSERHAALLREALETAEQPPLLGSIPKNSAWTIPERHLGLVTAAERSGDSGRYAELGKIMAARVDLDRLWTLCRRSVPEGDDPPPTVIRARSARPRLGVALDEAFQFYYPETLDLLRDQGVEPVFFSPLRDKTLPGELAGLYLGGGYPELYAERLSSNREMLRCVGEFAARGRPVYAECGGLMYLCESLRDGAGRAWPLCGVLPLRTRMQPRLQRLGYVEAETLHDGFFGPKGTVLRGHEYHWSDIEGDAAAGERLFRVRTPRGNSWSPKGWKRATVWASYLHLHFASNPAAVRAWAETLEKTAIPGLRAGNPLRDRERDGTSRTP